MTTQTSTIVNVASAVSVIIAVFTFWIAANEQSARLADSIEEVRKSVRVTSEAAQDTRDVVMELKGQVTTLSMSNERLVRYLEKFDVRIRTLETGR